MTTHLPLMTNAIASHASPSRWWVMNSTPSYTTPTLPTSLTPPSSSLPTPFEGMTSAIGPHTPHSNKPLFSSALTTRRSFTNTANHGPLYLHYVYTTHLLRSIPLSQTPTLIFSRARTVAPLLPCHPPPRGYPVQSMSKCNEVETGGHGMMGWGPATSTLKDMLVRTQYARF